MENNENVINQEIKPEDNLEPNPEKSVLISLEYDQQVEETKAINKFALNIDFGISKIIIFSVCLLIGILALIIAKDRGFYKIMGWFLCVLSPIGIACIIIVKASSKASLKKLKNPSHILLYFCEDKIRYEETSAETLIKLTFEYKDIIKVYIHDNWVLLRTKQTYIMIQGNEKKYEIAELIKSKTDKIKVYSK